MEINEKASCIPCAQVLQSNSLGQYVMDSEEEDETFQCDIPSREKCPRFSNSAFKTECGIFLLYIYITLKHNGFWKNKITKNISSYN